jgi:hypothetical protein
MDLITRRNLLALLALPAGCSLQPLAPLKVSAGHMQTPLPQVRAPAIGQSWRYTLLNCYNGNVLDTLKEEVTSVGLRITVQRQSGQTGKLMDEIHTRWGQVQQDPSWDLLQIYETPMPLWLQPLQTGTTQSIDSHYTHASSSFRYWIQADIQVMGRETVDLAIGSFQTIRIEKRIRQTHYDNGKLFLQRRETLWLAPETGRWVVRETDGGFRRAGKKLDEGREDHFRWELTAWT